MILDKKRNSVLFKNDNATTLYSRSLVSMQRMSKVPKSVVYYDNSCTDEYIAHTSTSAEERIQQYELKYKVCMESNTKLSSWLKSCQGKGSPCNLLEEEYKRYTTTTTTTTTTISTPVSKHIFTSISQKPPKRTHDVNRKRDTITPSVKSSISTLIKKATGSIKPTKYKHERGSKDCMFLASDSIEMIGVQRKKALLNRFSFYEGGRNNIAPSTQKTIDKTSIRVVPETTCKMEGYSILTSAPSSNRTTLRTTTEDTKRISVTDENNKLNQEITSAVMRKTQSEETMLSHSSSIFLRKLQSKTPSMSTIGETAADAEMATQLNVPLKTKTYQFSVRSGSVSSELTEDDGSSSHSSTTLPSSPASIDSIVLSPLFVASQHPYTTTYRLERQASVNDEGRDLVANKIPTKNTTDVHSASRPHLLRQQQQVHQKQKNRASILILAPSFSTIRNFSQKSQFFKRQSMLA